MKKYCRLIIITINAVKSTNTLSGISTREKYFKRSFLFFEIIVKSTNRNNTRRKNHIYQVKTLKAFSRKFQLGSGDIPSRDSSQGKKSERVHTKIQNMLIFVPVLNSLYR